MIINIGTDIIDIRRIKKTINKYGNKFKKRCFHKSEILKSENRLKTAESYSKRYAAKEAFSKATGFGISNNLHFKNIEIDNNRKGKPSINLDKSTCIYLKKKFKVKSFRTNLSLSDEKNYSIAYVVIEKKW